MKLASVLFLLGALLGAPQCDPVQCAELEIVDSPVEIQVVFDQAGNEVDRVTGDQDSVSASSVAWYTGSTILHNHPTSGVWYFSAQDYYFAWRFNVKTMIVVNRLQRGIYKRCIMTRLGQYWRDDYIDHGLDVTKLLARLERELNRHGYDRFWRRWSIVANLSYHCENVSQ